MIFSKNKSSLGIIIEKKLTWYFKQCYVFTSQRSRQENRSTGKMHVVFEILNACVKVVYDPSLNDILYKGPCLQLNLYDLPLAFRVKPVVATGDIDKAFLQIIVHIVYSLKNYIIVHPMKFKLIVLLD